MPVFTRLPCELEEEDEEKAELRELVDRFDNLFEDCWRTRLRPEDEKELNELYQFLLIKEEEAWRDTSILIIDQVTDHVDIKFPLLRYTIGMLS